MGKVWAESGVACRLGVVAVSTVSYHNLQSKIHVMSIKTCVSVKKLVFHTQRYKDIYNIIRFAGSTIKVEIFTINN